MSEYRVYRVGEPEPVQGVRRASPSRWPRLAASATPAPPGGAPAPGSAPSLIWAVVAVAAAVAVGALLVLRPRHARQLRAPPSTSRGSRARCPAGRWSARPSSPSPSSPPVTAYLAFGRHLALKLVGVAVVVVTLAAPGLALGLGQRHGQRRRRTAAPSRQAVVTKTEKELRPALPGKADEHPAHRLGQDEDPRRHRALRHADPRAPRPRDQEHLDALGAARPARRRSPTTATTR